MSNFISSWNKGGDRGHRERGWKRFVSFGLCGARCSCLGVNKFAAARFRGSLLIQLYFSQGAQLADHVEPLVSADGVTVFQDYCGFRTRARVVRRETIPEE